MLVDLPRDWRPLFDPVMSALVDGSRWPVRLAEGVYEVHLNFNHELRGILVSEYPFTDRHRELASAGIVDWAGIEADPQDYGVCDSWGQILERWPVIAADPSHQYMILLTRIVKAEQESDGGWRWHKWGEYIGVHEPRHEHLYDEDGIEQVFVFHIVEMRASWYVATR